MGNLALVEQEFEFEGSRLDSIMYRGRPYWVARDIGDLLGYSSGRGSKLVKIIRKMWMAEFEEGVDYVIIRGEELEQFKRLMEESTEKVLSLRQANSIMLLSEEGVYLACIKTHKPIGIKLRRWLKRDVMPSIMGHGYYDMRKTMFSDMTPEFEAALKLAEIFGYRDNQALLTANKAIKKVYGTDIQSTMGMTHLVSPKQERLLTATELGRRVGLLRNEVNPQLENLRLLDRHYDHHEHVQWELTEKGLDYGVYLDVGKERSAGTPVQQIKWYASVIDLIKTSRS